MALRKNNMIEWIRSLVFNGSESYDTTGPLALEFEVERQHMLTRTVAIGAILAAVLVPLFGMLDLVFKYHAVKPFFVIRLSVTLISITVFLLLKTPHGKKHPYWFGAFLAIVVGGSIALMCHLDEGPVDRYYAGINLPLLGFGILLPLTLNEGIIVFSLVWLSYFIPNLFVLQPDQTGIFLSNNFFMISTIIIALASSQFHLYVRKQQWYTHKRLEAAHKKIQNHAKELEKKVQERTQKLLQSERLAVVGQLAGGVAHDFNNFLTAILGTSELLLYSLPDEDPTRNDIECIARVGQKAADLVAQLLAFSRRQMMSPKTLDLNTVIRDLKKMLTRVIGENIELDILLDPDLGRIHADPLQMEQILLNLCVNARDAMPNGGRLIIETHNIHLDSTYCSQRTISIKPGDYILMSVTDTGTGMKEEIKARIFEPFFTTKQKGVGTGLGLSSVYGIVKQSEGDILVYSELGKGTVFKIYLPRVYRKDRIEENPAKNPQHLPKGTETILLVEDEKDVRELTARMLENQGYTVLQASEGNEALNVAESFEKPIDLLMTDVVMPKMNGRVLARKLTSRRKNLKVLFLSGYTNQMILHQGIKNIHSFLQKPYTLETLSHKVRSVFKN